MKRMLKVTTLMSSTTVVNIILNIFKVKIMALLVGSMGMGIFSLLLGFYNIFVSLGSIVAGGSVVKAVAEANSENDMKKLYILQKLLVYVAIFLGLLFSFFIIVFQKSLSNFIFSDSSYASSLSLIGLVLIFANLGLFWQSWLNGFRRVKQIAKIRLYASFFITIFTIIILTIFKEEGIKYAVMILPIPAFFLAWYYGRKIEIKPFSLMASDIKSLKGVFTLGVILILISLIFQLGVLGARSLISNLTNIESVGIVFAAWMISMSYIEVFLSALSVDYYPTLVGMKDNNTEMNTHINNQIQFTLLIIFPVLLFLYIFSPHIITLLYDDTFLAAADILRYQIIGDVFKVLAWLFGYVLIIKHYLKFALLIQLFWVGSYLSMIWLGMSSIGLTIAGIAFLIAYMFVAIFSYWFLNQKIKFVFSKENKFFLILISLTMSIFLCFQFYENQIDIFFIQIIELLIACLFMLYSIKTITKNLRSQHEK